MINPHVNNTPTLPVVLIEEIIDVVAQCYPESLPSCALVSHQWNPRSTYHLYRIFSTPTIATYGALHFFRDIVKKHPRLAGLATSLAVAPDPEFDSDLATTSYIPFHHLSSRLLPNVRRLVLGENLRWGDYPLLYRNGTFASFFYEVTAIDLSCHFGSLADLFRVIRSFRNVKDVRLIYPHCHVPPRWMFNQTHIPGRHGVLSREMFKIQNLELSLVILKPALDVCGDSVVNLSVACPRMSTVSRLDAVESGKRLAFACSLTSLQTVKITVPVESNDPMSRAGLRKLFYLSIAPITQSNVRYSLFLVQCQKHNAVGYRVEGTSKTTIRRLVKASAKMYPKMERCQECSKTNDEGKSYQYPAFRTPSVTTGALADRFPERPLRLTEYDELLGIPTPYTSGRIGAEWPHGVSLARVLSGEISDLDTPVFLSDPLPKKASFRFEFPNHPVYRRANRAVRLHSKAGSP